MAKSRLFTDDFNSNYLDKLTDPNWNESITNPSTFVGGKWFEGSPAPTYPCGPTVPPTALSGRMSFFNTAQPSGCNTSYEKLLVCQANTGPFPSVIAKVRYNYYPSAPTYETKMASLYARLVPPNLTAFSYGALKFWFQYSQNRWVLQQWQGGSVAVKGTYSGDVPVMNTDQKLELRVNEDNTADCLIDDVIRISASILDMSTYPNPLYAGVGALTQGGPETNSQQMEFDYFYIDVPSDEPPTPLPVVYPGLQSVSSIYQKLIPGIPQIAQMDDSIFALTGDWDKPWGDDGWGFQASSVLVRNTGAEDLIASIDGYYFKTIRAGSEYEWTRRNDMGQNFVLKGTADEPYEIIITK